MAHDESPYRASTHGTHVIRSWRGFGSWPVGLALFVALLALLTSLQLFQLTADGASKHTLRRSVAALTEIDQLMDRNYDDLQRSAENASSGETVELRDFPIAIALQPAEVIGRSKDQIRDTLLARSADVMYKQGSTPLRAPGAKDGNATRFSGAGVTQHGIGFLRSRNHNILAVTTFVLAVVCAALAATLASMRRGFSRLTAVGAAMLAAATPVVLGGIGAQLLVRLATDGDTEYIKREFLAIGQSLAWISIRDGAAFAILGLLVMVIGLACAAWADRREAARVSVALP